MKAAFASVLLIALSSAVAFAEGPNSSPNVPTHLGSIAQRQRAGAWNRAHSQPGMMRPLGVTGTPFRPFSEIEETGYVAISGESEWELDDLRLAIVKNIPAPTVLVVYVNNTALASRLRSQYAKYLGPDRLKFLLVPRGSDEIWGRDALPFPVYLTPNSFGLVDSIYPQNFEPDAAFSRSLSLPMRKTNLVFRGGNLLLDLDGNCFAENVNEVAELQDATTFLKTYFGCRSVTLLPFNGGIGDLDERLKFLTGKDVLSDDASYAKILEAKGYRVHPIPSTGARMETYMNTLYVNGTIFVPQMGIKADGDALDAYRALGMKPVGVITKRLADEGNGNIHCLTMNYPVGTFVQSTRGADFVQFEGRN